MNRARLYLGIAFAAPVTILTGLFYILPFWALGWYRCLGWMVTTVPDKSPLGAAWAFVLNADKAPAFLTKYWANWGGHCVGTVVVLKNTPFERVIVLNHELHHANQMHKLGFFQPILYAMSMLTSWAAEENTYATDIFEVAARRAAGQVVDVDSFVQGFALGKKTGQK
jgi:hypothetical protein